MIVPSSQVTRRDLAKLPPVPEVEPSGPGRYWRPIAFLDVLEAFDEEMAALGWGSRFESIEGRSKGRDSILAGRQVYSVDRPRGAAADVLGRPQLAAAIRFSNDQSHAPAVWAGLVAENGGVASLGPWIAPRPEPGVRYSAAYVAQTLATLWEKRAADLLGAARAFDAIPLDTADGDALLVRGAVRGLWNWRQVGYAAEIWNWHADLRDVGFEDRSLLSWLYAFGQGSQRRGPDRQLETMRGAFRIAKTVQVRGLDALLRPPARG